MQYLITLEGMSFLCLNSFVFLAKYENPNIYELYTMTADIYIKLENPTEVRWFTLKQIGSYPCARRCHPWPTDIWGKPSTWRTETQTNKHVKKKLRGKKIQHPFMIKQK